MACHVRELDAVGYIADLTALHSSAALRASAAASVVVVVVEEHC
jgi:hypothetical protein